MQEALVMQSLRLERLAVYHDSGSKPWSMERIWEDMTPQEWEEVCYELVNHRYLMYLGMVLTLEYNKIYLVA